MTFPTVGVRSARASFLLALLLVLGALGEAGLSSAAASSQQAASSPEDAATSPPPAVALGPDHDLVTGTDRAAPALAIQGTLKDRISAGQTVHLNMVVILADFTDLAADRIHSTPAHFDSLLFSRGIYPSGSMADYFAENANGKFVLDGRVIGWYRMPRPYEAYVSRAAGRGLYPLNSQGLVDDAVAAADRDVNYALFDNDGADGVPDTFDDDQMIDLLMVVHAGPGGESAASATRLQSLVFSLPFPTPVDGVYADLFAITPEFANLGVYAHETGHLLGLPDLYAISGNSLGLGAWSLMAGGWSLDLARTPAHLDGWCKSQLGFNQVVNVQGVVPDAPIDPVAAGGVLYRLAAGGSLGPEYFLVENRRRTGFDRFLPGEGLLIYHVDERHQFNRAPRQYRVALEQADGLFQLENLGHGVNFGDDGDPWRADSPTGGFGRFTIPDSRTNLGAETGVTIYHVAGPDPSGRMRADLRSVIGPSIRLDEIDAPTVVGDGDGFNEAGETVEIRPQLIVSTGTAHGVHLELTAADPFAQVLDTELDAGDLTVGRHDLTTGFRVQIAPGILADPYGLDFRLKISFQEEVAVERFFELAVGDSVGLADNFERGSIGWQHDQVRPGYFDLWRREPNGGNPSGGGTNAWHCGNPTGGFPAPTDAALISPLFIIPESAILRFDQLVDIPPDDSNEVVAGAFVEISVNGGEWAQITPTRGYDGLFFGPDESLRARPILTGRKNSGTWETLAFDLSGARGGAQLRFRFFSTATLFVGKGWWIDNLTLVDSRTPVRLASFAGERQGGDIALRWTLAGDDRPEGVNVWGGGSGASELKRLNATLLAGGAGGRFVDRSPGAGERRYELEAIERGGSRLWLGRIVVPAEASAGRAELVAAPNPTSGATEFSIRLPAAGPVAVAIFDAAGRNLRSCFRGEMEAGPTLLPWDGRDDRGRRVPAGLYFCRLTTGRESLTRKVVIRP